MAWFYCGMHRCVFNALYNESIYGTHILVRYRYVQHVSNRDSVISVIVAVVF